MNKRIVVNAPLNQLSFGNVSYNLLKEFYKMGQEILLLPHSNFDLSSFDGADPKFVQWLVDSAKDNLSRLDKDDVALKLWHVSGSHELSARKQVLFSFYELDSPTETEKSVVSYQDATIFSSRHARDLFSDCGNVNFVPLGFDTDLKFMEKEYFDKDVVHFTLMGKAEKRKNTSKIIKTWIDTFGGDQKYKLTCLINNGHVKEDWVKAFQADILSGREGKMSNVSFLPTLPKNSQMNDLLCSSDIDLTCLSGAEGWNLPAFNVACLGGAVIGNSFTSHGDWAQDCAKFFEVSSGFVTEPAADGVFFNSQGDFNVGNIMKLEDTTELVEVMKTVAGKVLSWKSDICYLTHKKFFGTQMQNKFPYAKTAKSIIEIIEKL